MQADTLVDPKSMSALSPLDRFLGSENDVLRSAAVLALPVLGASEPARDALLAARLDPDEDVRSDAMEALRIMAEPEDAGAILHSLQGDPVREVKLAAIATLSRLGAPAAVPLLRALVISRSDEKVAWEDATGDWEDWLDIQKAAILALGEIQAEESIEELLTALNDPYGQSLTTEVFAALATMGTAGANTILAVFENGEGIVKRRAAAALAKVAPGSLQQARDALLAASEPELRLLAIPNLPVEDSARLAMADPDASVRCAALRRAAPDNPEIVRHCLADPDDNVKAVALQCLTPPFEPSFHEALIDNSLLWLESGRQVLAIEVAAKLVELAPNRAEGPLLMAVDNADQPLEVRVSAVKALNSAQMQVSTDALVQRLGNPARQVRAAILTVLEQRATAGDLEAANATTSAILGQLEFVTPVTRTDDEDAPDAGTPKEGSGPRKIWITPEGDIVENPDASDGRAPSTLDSILSGLEPAKQAEDTPEESGAKRAKRRAVEGSEDIEASLACDAMRIFAEVPYPALTDAILTRASDKDDMVRRAAWQSLVKRDFPDHGIKIAESAFGDSDPVIRNAAFRILCSRSDAQILAKGLEDDDALIQAEAIAQLPAEAALDFIASKTSAVRRSAIQCVLKSGDDALIARGLETAVASESQDGVAIFAARSGTGKVHALSFLARPELSDRAALIVLKGLRANSPKPL